MQGSVLYLTLSSERAPSSPNLSCDRWQRLAEVERALWLDLRAPDSHLPCLTSCVLHLRACLCICRKGNTGTSPEDS